MSIFVHLLYWSCLLDGAVVQFIEILFDKAYFLNENPTIFRYSDILADVYIYIYIYDVPDSAVQGRKFMSG